MKNAPFIKNMAQHIDLTESSQDMHQRIISGLVTHIGDGPFIGGFDQSTLLELAVFLQLVWSYMLGLEETLAAAQHPVIKLWMQRVSKHLPANPTLVADNMLVNSVATGLLYAHQHLIF